MDLPRGLCDSVVKMQFNGGLVSSRLRAFAASREAGVDLKSRLKAAPTTSFRHDVSRNPGFSGGKVFDCEAGFDLQLQPGKPHHRGSEAQRNSMNLWGYLCGSVV